MRNEDTPTVSIDRVLKELENWRVGKPNASTTIPDGLWRKIFALETTLPASKIRTLLKISAKQYIRKHAKLSTHATADKKQNSGQKQADIVDLCQVKTSASMYKPLKIPATNTIIAEFRHADGRIMKIHSTSDGVEQLIRAFFQDLINAADNLPT